MTSFSACKLPCLLLLGCCQKSRSAHHCLSYSTVHPGPGELGTTRDRGPKLRKDLKASTAFRKDLEASNPFRKDLEASNVFLDYCLSMSTPLHPSIGNVIARTREQFGDRLITSVQVLQLNHMIIRLIGAKKVLDVGVYTGASALTAALALPAEGKVFALEKSKKYVAIAEENMKAAGVAHKVEFLTGEAKTSLERLCEAGQEDSFDCCYIDADKANYSTYFTLAIRLVRVGGVIAIDNTLYKGRVVEPRDRTGEHIHKANQSIVSTRNVETVLMNVGDGFTLVRKTGPSPGPLHVM